MRRIVDIGIIPEFLTNVMPEAAKAVVDTAIVSIPGAVIEALDTWLGQKLETVAPYVR
jgi:maleate cis-trans isomerase